LISENLLFDGEIHRPSNSMLRPGVIPVANQTSDTESRQDAAAEAVFASLSNAKVREYERARQWFFEHGHFAQTRLALRDEDSRERAAAARALGVVGSDLATADLIASLFDPDPEVRVAAVEALSRIGDSDVNASSLNALFGREESDFAEPARVVTEANKVGHELMVVDPQLQKLPRSVVADLSSANACRRASALAEVARSELTEKLSVIVSFFDDPSMDVRNAAAVAVSEIDPCRSAESFSEVLKRTPPERHHNIAGAIESSGLAAEAIRDLGNRNRERAYDALCLLALTAKCGAVQPLVQAIEEDARFEVRSASVKLLNLSGQAEVAQAAVKRRLNLT
jgi:HEAT repeat protein